MATRAFGSAKRPIGRAHRTDILGDAVTDLRNDIEEAFQIRENESDAGVFSSTPVQFDVTTVLTVQDLASGFIASNPGGNITLTTPTAAEIVIGLTSLLGRAAKVGDSLDLTINCLASHNATLTAGVGVTENLFGGSTQAAVQNEYNTFRFRVTQLADPANPAVQDQVDFFRVA